MPLLLGENHRVGVNRQPGVPGVDSAEVLSGGVGHGSGQVRTVLWISCVDTAGSAVALCPIDIPSEALTLVQFLAPSGDMSMRLTRSLNQVCFAVCDQNHPGRLPGPPC